MGTAKFNVEKFIGRNDFGLWRLKIRALLVQHGLQDALLREKNLPSTMQQNCWRKLIVPSFFFR